MSRTERIHELQTVWSPRLLADVASKFSSLPDTACGKPDHSAAPAGIGASHLAARTACLPTTACVYTCLLCFSTGICLVAGGAKHWPVNLPSARVRAQGPAFSRTQPIQLAGPFNRPCETPKCHRWQAHAICYSHVYGPACLERAQCCHAAKHCCMSQACTNGHVLVHHWMIWRMPAFVCTVFVPSTVCLGYQHALRRRCTMCLAGASAECCSLGQVSFLECDHVPVTN